MKRRTFNDLLEKKYIEDDQLLSYVYLDTFNVHYYSFYKYSAANTPLILQWLTLIATKLNTGQNPLTKTKLIH